MFLEDLLKALAEAQVRYCIVGGVAVNLHGVPRMTYDLDIVVVPEIDEQLIDATDLFARSIALSLTDTVVRVAAIEDLIAMKRASARPQDASDVALLERVRKGAP